MAAWFICKLNLITSTKNFTNFTNIARKINQYTTHMELYIELHRIRLKIQLNFLTY